MICILIIRWAAVDEQVFIYAIYRMHCCSYNKGICEKGIKQRGWLCANIGERQRPSLIRFTNIITNIRCIRIFTRESLEQSAEGLNISGE